MKFLIVDDDFTNRLLLQEILKDYARIHIAVDGKEAVQAVVFALDDNAPYDAVFLDIMMPRLNGQDALKEIRSIENERGFEIGKGTKIIMITALNDKRNIMESFKSQADGYIIKPVIQEDLINKLKNLGLI